MYWSQKESNAGQSNFGVVQIYWDETASTMMNSEFVILPVRAVLLNFIVNLPQKLRLYF